MNELNAEELLAAIGGEKEAAELAEGARTFLNDDIEDNGNSSIAVRSRAGDYSVRGTRTERLRSSSSPNR